ncbi:hypothetical protein AXE80_03240 [Wenyingzhuangia fucanilytica]|uniref:Heparinase n=1 Tax=Wenyingzhuangia fucanilytica TaxID=1790137 RepID=A0A1B1Y9G1_9FLAO|nr:hypothetical protein AXE80_03240 [Wenyingzhuangia fucanilytica]
MKNKILLLIIAVFFAEIVQGQEKLNISEYLKLKENKIISPSVKQIEMLKKVLPKQAFQPAPKISDRVFWNKIAATKSGKDYWELANSYISTKPEVPISDSIYRLANKEGNRGIYKPRYYRTMEKLEYFILAECLENKGRFLPQIENFSNAILSMKSWLHPNHDDNKNTVLEGKRMHIDLGARKFGSVLALANCLLENKLSSTLKEDINSNLQRRIIDSYLTSTKGLDRSNSWIKSTSNWNSVCTSGVVLTTITNSKNDEERLLTIGAAINSMEYYLSGFGDDGYCSEGLGYWGYGFGHYLYLAQILYDYTDGNINLFEFNYPEKLKNVGNFPENFEIQNLRCAPFADGVSRVSSKGSNFANVLSAKYFGAIKPTEIRMEEAAEQLIAWQHPKMFETNTNNTSSTLPDHTYFNDFGMVISRGKQKIPFSIAVKAGHNAENHNHSDVGTYVLVLGKDVMSGDIGAPSYTAGAFSEKNPARSSWGHPVPMIDHKLQSNGKEYRGIITKTNFSKDEDDIEMDLKPAYEISNLESLIRTVKNNKLDNGVITIKDTFSAKKNIDFGIAMMTLNEYKIVDENTVVLTSENQKIKAEITSNGGVIKISDELVPVKKLREGAPAYRIGVDFVKPIKNGSITVKYTLIK